MYLAVAPHDVKDTTHKRALLLYSAGEEVADILETLPDQGEAKDYDKGVTALNAYFHPKVDKTYEVYIFRNATSEVHTVKATSQKVKNKQCYWCGENYRHKGRPCPALSEV